MILGINGIEIEYHEAQSSGELEFLVDEYSVSRVLYLDTETTGLDVYSSRLLLLQLMDSSKKKVNVVNMASLCPSETKHLARILQDKELVIQNAPFDLQFLSWNIPELDLENLKVFDTKVAESVLCAGVQEHLRSYTSLKNISKRRLGLDLDKETRVEFIGYENDTFTEDQIKYAAMDVMVLPEIRSKQIEEIKKWGLDPTLRVEFELTKHVARMELNGVRVDIKLWRKIINEHEKLRQESYSRVYKLLEPYLDQKSLFEELPFNLNSSDQLLSILTKNVGLPLEDTSEQSLMSLNNPICSEILEYREHEKILSAFGEKTLGMVNSKTGRLHPDFNQCSTSTGRFSSDHPNIQQIPSKGKGAQIRRCFIPEDGFKMVCSDYSQIELRILAELSQEPKLLDAYNKEIDIHTQTASLAFGIPLSQVKADHRKIAKILNFATVYGGGPTAISKGIVQVISEEEARDILFNVFGKKVSKQGAYYSLSKEFVSSYFEKMPRARDWLESMGKKALVNRYSETPLGRKRFYVQELDESNKSGEDMKKTMGSVRRRGMNHPIQGCSADITKIAMNNLGREFHELNKDGIVARMVIQVHDEIVCEVKEEVEDIVSEVIRKCMVSAGEEFLKSVPVVVDIHVSDYWKK